jgi:hypothetical protein
MDDREMLELAARAAGHEIVCWQIDGFPLVKDDEHGLISWNPLAKWGNGDALRLAVKLHLTIRMYYGNACAQSTVPGGPSVYVDETNTADPEAATRRAIVRAAAEIGKSMEQQTEGAR